MTPTRPIATASSTSLTLEPSLDSHGEKQASTCQGMCEALNPMCACQCIGNPHNVHALFLLLQYQYQSERILALGSHVAYLQPCVFFSRSLIKSTSTPSHLQ